MRFVSFLVLFIIFGFAWSRRDFSAREEAQPYLGQITTPVAKEAVVRSDSKLWQGNSDLQRIEQEKPNSNDHNSSETQMITVVAPNSTHQAKAQAKAQPNSSDTAKVKGKSSSSHGEKTEEVTVLFLKVTSKHLVYGLSTVMFLLVAGITGCVLIHAFRELDVNPQDEEKSGEEVIKWRIVHVLALLNLDMKVSSVVLVAAQEPISDRLKMNLFDYNTMLAARCVPGLFAALLGPSLQQWFGSSHAILGLGLLHACGTVLQAVALAAGSYSLEMAAVLVLEGTSGCTMAITSAVIARLVQGEEQSRSVAIVAIYTFLGMATPLVTVPWLLEQAGLTLVCGSTTLLGGVCGLAAGFTFFHMTRTTPGGIGFDEPLVEGSKESVFSFSLWNAWTEGQGLCVIFVLAMVNGVAITLGENITEILTDNFKLKKTEVALILFIGLLACVVGQLIGPVLDSHGHRPVATGFATFLIACSVVLAMIHKWPIIAIAFWGIGYSFNLNTGFSSLPLIVPPSKISVIMALANSAQYLGFITIPILYGYCAQFYGNFGFGSLLLLLGVTTLALVAVSIYNVRHHRGSLFGTQKCGVGDNIAASDSASASGSAEPERTVASGSAEPERSVEGDTS